MHPMLNIGVRAARAAGRVITQNVDRVDASNISRKQKNDYVTEFDRQAEASIIQVLHKAYPDHAILGEESGLHGSEDAEYRWVVDPIDGTLNFIQGIPHFSVSIGLLRNGRPYQGVIYDPMRQELFTASKGEGAFLDGKRIRVSGANSLERAVIGTGFPHKPSLSFDRYETMTRHFTERVTGIRRLGSAALDLAYVSAGRLDGMWMMGISAWDVIAGGLMVREAGGLVNDFSGGDGWMNGGEIVAASPKVQHQMLQGLAGSGKADA
ncbi:MAG: inositol monophosphatase [Gammaproteobacteria bacterium]|nr:MAG: inositol monophosphatase [Gammaproteobacteria bacterium]